MVVGCLKSTGLANRSRLWETIRMSEKRTKADKAQRQADRLENKESRRPAQTRKKKPTREDFSHAALGRSGS
jgi:hypothetical protein